jgi:hypothetical protein
MLENAGDCFGIGYFANHAKIPAAFRTRTQFDTEHPVESGHPGHGRMGSLARRGVASVPADVSDASERVRLGSGGDSFHRSTVQMIGQGRAGLDGILLLFIYLELGAMVGIYFKTSHLPVRFLLYIAITALTRLLAIDAKATPDQHILVITGAIVLLVMAVATISMVRFKFPEKEPS